MTVDILPPHEQRGTIYSFEQVINFLNTNSYRNAIFHLEVPEGLVSMRLIPKLEDSREGVMQKLDEPLKEGDRKQCFVELSIKKDKGTLTVEPTIVIRKIRSTGQKEIMHSSPLPEREFPRNIESLLQSIPFRYGSLTVNIPEGMAEREYIPKIVDEDNRGQLLSQLHKTPREGEERRCFLSMVLSGERLTASDPTLNIGTYIQADPTTLESHLLTGHAAPFPLNA